MIFGGTSDENVIADTTIITLGEHESFLKALLVADFFHFLLMNAAYSFSFKQKSMSVYRV